MAQIDFPDIINQIKNGIVSLAQATVSNYLSDAKSDAQTLLDTMMTKLETWTQLLANGKLTTDDFEWLVYSQKDLVEMSALEQSGLAKIRLDQFKGSVLNLIIDTIFQVVKI
jgi:hypothetical protein